MRNNRQNRPEQPAERRDDSSSFPPEEFEVNGVMYRYREINGEMVLQRVQPDSDSKSADGLRTKTDKIREIKDKDRQPDSRISPRMLSLILGGSLVVGFGAVKLAPNFQAWINSINIGEKDMTASSYLESRLSGIALQEFSLEAESNIMWQVMTKEGQPAFYPEIEFVDEKDPRHPRVFVDEETGATVIINLRPKEGADNAFSVYDRSGGDAAVVNLNSLEASVGYYTAPDQAVKSEIINFDASIVPDVAPESIDAVSAAQIEEGTANLIQYEFLQSVTHELAGIEINENNPAEFRDETSDYETYINEFAEESLREAIENLVENDPAVSGRLPDGIEVEFMGELEIAKPPIIPGQDSLHLEINHENLEIKNFEPKVTVAEGE